MRRASLHEIGVKTRRAVPRLRQCLRVLTSYIRLIHNDAPYRRCAMKLHGNAALTVAQRGFVAQMDGKKQ
jgi:hypothetical protein